MWRVLRVLQRGCLLHEIKARPSLVCGSGVDQQQRPTDQEHIRRDGLLGRGICHSQNQTNFVAQPLPWHLAEEDRVDSGCSTSNGEVQRRETEEDGTSTSFEQNRGRGGVDEGSSSSSDGQHETEQNEEGAGGFSSQTEHEKTDHDWQSSWTHSCQYDMWSRHNPYHVLEAVGWGTALLSGLRISHLLHCSRDREQEMSHCWVRHLHKLTVPLIKQHLLQLEMGCYATVKAVLPHGISRSLHLPSSTTQSDATSHALKSAEEALKTFSFGGLQDDEATVSASGSPPPEFVSEAKKGLKHQVELTTPLTSRPPGSLTSQLSKSEFDELSIDWQEALQNMTAMIANKEGVDLARRGDMEGAIKMWKQAVEEAEYAKAHFNLALAYEQGLGVKRDVEKALQHYSSASQRDHAPSLYNQAMIHLRRGRDITNNKKIALNLLEKAVKLDFKEAQRELGVLCTEPPEPDMERAAKLFQLAASQEDVKATYFLGICYENGCGVAKDEGKAAALYGRAAAAGHAEAQFNLGVFYEIGRGGLTCDRCKAMELYKLADAGGCERAGQQLRQLQVALKEGGGDADRSSKIDTISAPSNEGSLKKHPQRNMLSSYDSDSLSEDSISDSESVYSDSVYGSSGSEFSCQSHSPVTLPSHAASAKRTKVSFGGKKSLRSGIFIGFSSEEDISDTSDVEEYKSKGPAKLLRARRAF